MPDGSDGPIVIQGEALEIVQPGSGGDLSLVRTRVSNPERMPGAADAVLPQFDGFGLRPGYTGEGYVDVEGEAGTKLAFAFEAEPGTYDVTLRLANGSVASPIYLRSDATGEPVLDVPSRTPDWYVWELRTFTVEVIGDPDVVGPQTHRVEIVTEAADGPHIDAVAIGPVGAPVSFVAPIIETTSLAVAENGLEAGAILGTDLDSQALTYAIAGGADADGFAITPDGTLSFRNAPDFETPGSTAGTNIYDVEVSATDGVDTVTQAVAVEVTDLAEAPADANASAPVTFDQSAITAYNSQDRPGQGGAGAVVSADGRAITLDGNLWKRAAVDPFTVETDSVLRVTLQIVTPGEIIAIGFDEDSDPFDNDGSLYQLAGSQRLATLVDLRGTGTAVGDTLTFEIDLSAHAGKTAESLVLITDDDDGRDGRAEVIFSDIEITGQAAGGNSDPRVVGGGIADLAVEEGNSVEIGLPFVDDDDDDLSYAIEVLRDGAPVAGFPLAVVGGTLTGTLGATAPGLYAVTVTADDGQGGVAATDSFVLDVQEANAAPVADPDAAFEPYFGDIGQAIVPIALDTFAASFSDPDGDALTLSVEGLPAGLSVDGAGRVTGTPTEAGDGSFTVIATDSGGLTASLEVGLVLSAPESGEITVVEAEDFTGLPDATAFFATARAGASGDRLIRTTVGKDAAVETRLSENGVADGWYKVAIDIYDETDGSASYSLSVGGVQLSADGATFDDPGTFTDPDSPRGGAGQIGNRKRLAFDEVVRVDADTILTLTGRSDGELLRTDRVLLERVDPPSSAPGGLALAGAPVAENVAGAEVGTLSATDPDGDDAAIVYSVAAASPFEVVGDVLRLKPGESLDFEAGDTVTVDVTATDATGAATTATLTIAVADVDEAPEALLLVGEAVDENAAGAVIGTLGALDPEDGTLIFTVADPRFTVEDATLRLADGVSLDAEVDAPLSIDVSVSDGVNAVTRAFDVTIADLNDAPTLALGAGLADVVTGIGVESRTDLTPLGAADQDVGDAVSYDLRSGTGDPLPAGIAILAGELVVAGDVAAGTYAVEVFATDGTAESDAISLSVTVGDTPPFAPFALQAETGTITLRDAADNQSTQVRDADNPEVGGTFLRPDFTGDGYVDYGNDGGDTLTLTVTVPTDGDYDLNVRYASGTTRPLELAVNGVDAATPMAFASTDPDGSGAESGFDHWAFETRTITLQAGVNSVAFAIPAGATSGPNLDRIEITAAGTGPIRPADTDADEDDNLTLVGDTGELSGAQAASINLRVEGRDADIVRIELSFDGGATRLDVTDIVDADGDFVVDGTGLAAGPQTATIIVTDAAGNEASDDLSFSIAGVGTVGFEPVTIQAEDGTQATIVDTTTGTGPGDPRNTQVADAADPGPSGALLPGAVGEAYVDMGSDPGDALAFTIDVPADGAYTAAIRYANGSIADRPMIISVGGAISETIAFAPTSDGSGTPDWAEVTVVLDLVAGTNTVTLAVPDGGVEGPEIDQITFDDVDPNARPDDAERFEDVIRVNFEAPATGNGAFDAPAGYETPEGFEADTGAAFGDRGNGFTYGWVGVTAGAVTGAPEAQPVGSARHKDAVAGASDLQKTYLHFDYPGGGTDAARAWELALENGTYQLTVAIGDIAGQYDSTYLLNAEGTQFGPAWAPLNFAGQQLVGDGYDASFDGEGFRSNLVTGIVQVADGRLTLDGLSGDNVEIQWLDLQRLPDLTPDDARTADLDYSKFIDARAASTENGQVTIEIGPDGAVPLGINPTSDIVLGVQLQAIDHRGPAVAFTDGVKLVETLTGIEVPVNVQVTGGADSLTIRPLDELRESTSYTLVVEDVLDLGDLNDGTQPLRQFQDYTTTFVTGERPEVVDREVAFTDEVLIDGFADGGIALTSVEFGPDGKLYASSIGGTITRWDVNADGTLDKASAEVLALDYFADTGRSIIGLAIDPEDPNTIWVTDNAPVPRQGRSEQIPEFSGQVSKITLGADGSFEGAVAETYVTGLPRSGGDHVTNSLEFRANPEAGVDGAPNYLLYFTQGSNSAAGAPDNAWGFRPERLLNAAVLELDHTRGAPDGGFDVQTEPFEGSDPTFRTPLPFNADGTFPGAYDPFADDAVLRIFGEGVRNAYDLVWHSNGQLYVPTNGTAAGGNSPDDPNTAIDESLSGHKTQFDYLFTVEEGGYYGHPNPLLDNYVLNGGNPTAGPDLNGQNTGIYPVGVEPDAEYDVGGVYALGFNKSPNGAVEYTGDAFGANLKGAVLFAQFSQGDNVRVINVDPVTGEITGDDVLRRRGGDEIDDYIDPLDIIENPVTGQLYLMTLNRGTGASQIVLLTPDVVEPPADETADAGGDLAISVLDGSDASAVVFAIAGLDDDIETVAVSFDGGITSEIVTLDADGRFVRDLSSATGTVTAQLTVTDVAANTAGTSISFGLDDATAPAFIDARFLTILDTDDGTVIRKLEDATTHEPEGGADDLDGDGLADGYDGDSYLDLAGGPEDKASLTYQAVGAGVYRLVFRMASETEGSIIVETAGQSETITVDTGALTAWQDFAVDLDLVDGPNRIMIAQSGANGPTIDSVEVTPIAVEVDDTADVDGDLAVTLLDASERGATVFEVIGLDDDVETVTVSFDGAPAQEVAPTAGTFTANTSALSGDVSVTLAVVDASGNTASATLDANFAPVVPNDGISAIGGIDYVLYEAENAVLDGAVVVDEAIEDRGAEGAGFVDFDSPADQSITWTIEVGQDGTYAADILYALSVDETSPRPLTLLVDGVQQEVLPFAQNSNADGTIWRPQPFTLDLLAGVHTVTVTAPGGIGPDVDQLRITTEPGLPGDPDADIAVRSLDPAYFDDRLHFSWIDDPAAGETTARDVKENAFVEIANTGSADLVIDGAAISGPFVLANPDLFDGLVLGAGQAVTAEVLFDRSAYAAGDEAASGVFEGALTLRSNDDEDPVTTIDLAGFWQERNAGGWEPNVNEVWQVFGFGNDVDGLSTEAGGDGSVLDFYDLYLPVDETEILSPYWQIADGVTEVRMTTIASYSDAAEGPLGLHAPGDASDFYQLSRWSGPQNQTILPLEGDGGFATQVFGAGKVPDRWDGDEVFGIGVAGFSTDPTLNPSGSGVVTQAELDARYPGYTVLGGTVLDPEGNVVPDGHSVRMFQAVDASGAAIENVFLGVMGDTGAGYAYNDTMFVVEGIQAAGTGAGFEISGLDDAAADDRLVFTNIEFPKNAAQVFRNEATFTIENDGASVLTIETLSVTGDFVVTGLSAGDTIAPGGTAQVNVEFVGTDGVNDDAAVLLEGGLSIGTNAGTKTVALAGLAQLQSESGEEPSVAQIVRAFGYSTDVAQPLLKNGAKVETVGDEVLLPYLQRLDPSAPVEIINMAAFLQQGNISRLNIHELDSDALTELFAGDDQQGQTVLPGGLVVGAGDTGSVGRASVDRDAPFGLKVTVDGRPTFAAWTDPEANKAEDALRVTDEGHYIRFFQAKDSSGADIEGSFVGIQDYPGGGNFDYNDAMFLVTNVQGYDLAAAEDTNADGINDALQIDADNDGTVAFFDPDDGGTDPAVQAAFNTGGTPWAVDADGLTLMASLFDSGGQGVAYNDTTSASLGNATARPGEAVDIAGTGAVGYTAAGEWLEYTIDVAGAGDYALVFESSSPTGGRTLSTTFAQGGTVYESVQAEVPNTGAYGTFASSVAETVSLEAGEQVLRVTFDIDRQDLMSFTLDRIDPGPVQAPFPGPDAPAIGADAVTLDAGDFDAGGQGISWNDDPGRANGTQATRADTDVELVGAEQDIGFVTAGEWVEYTVDVAQAGTYALSVEARAPGSDAAVTVSSADGATLASFALPDGNGADTGFGGTAFAETATQEVTLAAGEQVLRVSFEGTPAADGQSLLEYRGLTLDRTEDDTGGGDGDGPLTFAAGDFFSYGGSQDKGTATVSADGTGVTLTDNAWKAIALDTEVTADTVLRFEFASDVEGEVQGIGFGRDGLPFSQVDEFLFQLDGTQTFGNQDFDGDYVTGSGPKSYQIDVGTYFTGSFDRLVFVMDDDNAPIDADSAFSNIEIL